MVYPSRRQLLFGGYTHPVCELKMCQGHVQLDAASAGPRVAALAHAQYGVFWQLARGGLQPLVLFAMRCTRI
jgi:hypothetical protein